MDLLSYNAALCISHVRYDDHFEKKLLQLTFIDFKWLANDLLVHVASSLCACLARLFGTVLAMACSDFRSDTVFYITIIVSSGFCRLPFAVETVFVVKTLLASFLLSRITETVGEHLIRISDFVEVFVSVDSLVQVYVFELYVSLIFWSFHTCHIHTVTAASSLCLVGRLNLTWVELGVFVDVVVGITSVLDKVLVVVLESVQVGHCVTSAKKSVMWGNRLGRGYLFHLCTQTLHRTCVSPRSMQNQIYEKTGTRPSRSLSSNNDLIIILTPSIDRREIIESLNMDD